VRRKNSTPIIPDDWCGEKTAKNMAAWGNPAFADPRNANKPLHARKEVTFDPTNHLYTDCDSYYSGRKFLSKIDSDSPEHSERLTIEYNYESARNGKEPWTCILDSDTADEGSTISLAEAERILQKWGIKRLNY
jgi:hypothetical protein